LGGDVKLSRTAHFEIGIDDQGRNFTIYNMENFKISLIGYSDFKDFKWNESFEKLAKCLKNEIFWHSRINK
jgi:hypothetical protein